MKFHVKKGRSRAPVRFLVSIIIGGLLLYYTLKPFDLNKILFSALEANRYYLVIAFVFLVIAYLIRGYRWTIWQKELDYWKSFKLILIGFMGNNVLPARLGELLRAHCSGSETSDQFGRTAALASIAIERVLDGLILSVLTFVGLCLVKLGRTITLSLLTVSLAFAVLTIFFLVGINYHQAIRAFLKRLSLRFPGHLTQFTMAKVNYFLDGLLLIKRPRDQIKALLITLLIWSVELISYYIISVSISDEIPLPTSLIFLAAVNFASLFPFTIGGVGAIEGATTACLISAGVPGTAAITMVLIQHGYQFLFTTVLGCLFYFSGKYYNIPLVGAHEKVDFKEARSEIGKDFIRSAKKDLIKLSERLNIERRPRETPLLSIIIPAYNEQSRLPKTILETISWCTENIPSYEIIIVDDGSTDETLALAKLFADTIRNIYVLACPHLGKGAAVRMGMLNGRGEYVLFMDADGATPLDEISKLISAIQGGADVAIGSRVVQDPRETEVITSKHRKFIGRVFAAIVNVFAVSGVSDTQCGFKMFKGKVAHDLFLEQKINGFAFDVEILFLAKKKGLSIREIPVNWVNKEGSKVNVIIDSFKMLSDILKIRWLHK